MEHWQASIELTSQGLKRPQQKQRRCGAWNEGAGQMNIKVNSRKVSDDQVTLEVRVPAAELSDLKRGARLVVAKRNGIDLSKDMSAEQILQEELGAQAAAEQVESELCKFVAPFALSSEEQGYSVVGAPRISEPAKTTDAGDLVFTATWTRLPRVELSSYEPVTIAIEPVTVGEDEIAAQLEKIADSYKGVEVDPDRDIAHEGDILQISMECFKDGERYDQLCFEKRLYRAGSHQMPEGFDEALDSAKVGQTRHVDFLLPVRQDIDGTMTGPSLGADVTVEAIMRERPCELTDEFVAANIPHARNVEELKVQVRSQLESQKQRDQRHIKNQLAAEELSKRIQGTIADACYEAVVDQMTDSLFEQARAQGKTPEELLSEEGSDLKRFKMAALVQARAQLRHNAALDAWARHRNIEIDEDDIDEFFKSSVSKGADQMRDELGRGGYEYLVREGALRLKANDDLSSCAVVEDSAA